MDVLSLTHFLRAIESNTGNSFHFSVSQKRSEKRHPVGERLKGRQLMRSPLRLARRSISKR